jgi:superfamily II DNA or RNA helicase
MPFQASIFPTKTILKTPPLEIKIKHPLGFIFHVFDNGGEKDVLEVGKIQISAQTEVELFTLSDGQKIIVSNKKNITRPKEVDGILLIKENGDYVWSSHRLLEKFKKETENNGLESISSEIEKSWDGKFNFNTEKRDENGGIIKNGLRPPQIGGLHAIGTHWSLYKQPATIVMPTGTGKTETMLSLMTAYLPGKILIIVPSKTLRDQTVKKFKSLGLLRILGNLPTEVRNPVVGIITSQPKLDSDLDIFKKCNVVISTMSALVEKESLRLTRKIAKNIDTLIVDEAHHVAAKSWAAFREYFINCKILQFTATPYRRDGKLVDGKVIYDYPLKIAQKEGYFKPISFKPVYEIDREAADQEIAKIAVNQLRKDTSDGFDHLVMVRCANFDRSDALFSIYKSIAPEFNPIVINSEQGDTSAELEKLYSRESRIVICVNMLGEGFDLPQLKIAAVHDTHKSLAILLQFTGRFTRSSAELIGNATIIANIADQQVSSALERLYSEDADWNKLLSEFSSEASRTHAELINFLNSSERIDDNSKEEKIQISHHLLRPKLSTLIYNANNFTPKNFFNGIPKGIEVHSVWIHDESNTIYFVTRSEPSVQWARSRQLKNHEWHLFVIHYDKKQNLIFLHSSDKDSDHTKLASAVGAANNISGEIIFKSLGKINRLIFQNIGVRKLGRRNLSFAMYTGSDVVNALSLTESGSTSVKSNLSGSGWEDGKQITIGCSLKGRVWSREPGTIPEFIKWCESIGNKIKDDTINTEDIIKNVLLPKQINAIPDKNILSIEWPHEILRQSEERVLLSFRGEELPLSLFDIKFIKADLLSNRIEFCILQEDGNVLSSLVLILEDSTFKVLRTSEEIVNIKIGKLEKSIEEYLSDYPPLIQFIDLSELDGNLLIEPRDQRDLEIPKERFEAWDWNGTDIKKESIWKNNTERHDSIQWKVAQKFIQGGFDIVFDDDGAGEAADLVCFKEEDDYLRLVLIHCKFTKESSSGSRVKDVVEVSSQAVRSVKWKWKFRDLCYHILTREKSLQNKSRKTRFLNGNSSELNRFVQLSRFKEIKPEIIIAQPGLSIEKCSKEQTAVLASTHSYLKETIGVDLDIIYSK